MRTTICFLTLNADFCSDLALLLAEEGFACHVCTSLSQLGESGALVGSSQTIIAADYFFFGQEIANPCTFVWELVNHPEEAGALPVIWYNSPFASPHERAVFFLSQIERGMGQFLPLSSIDDFWDAFVALQRALCAVENNETLSRSQFSLLADFRAKSGIHEAKWNLLVYLFQNQHRALSNEELCIHLFGEYSENHASTLYSYISALRKAIKEAGCPFSIERAAKKCYRLSFLPPAQDCTVQSPPFQPPTEPSPLQSIRAFLSLPAEYSITFP